MPNEKRWQELESGQALMEYWPTIPAAIMIIISAGLISNFVRGAFSDTTDVLYRSSAGIELEVCETTDDQVGQDSEVVDNHLIELVSSHFDGENTTVVYRVTSAEDPSCADDEKQKGNNGVGNGEDGQPPGNPPVNDGEGTSPGNPGNKGGADTTDTGTTDTASINNGSDTAAIDSWVLSLPKDVADNIIDQSESGNWVNNDTETGATGIKFDTTYSDPDNVCTVDEKQKGNNGVGNGEDGQPPGNPPVNDGEGTSPGNPGNQGGADTTDTTDTTDDTSKGNNGVGNGEDGQPPGDPPVNDGEGTSPGNPGNQGGANTDDTDDTTTDTEDEKTNNGKSDEKSNNGKNNKRKIIGRQLINTYLFQESITTTITVPQGEEREIFLLLSGQYDFDEVTVTTYSGGNTATGQILAPFRVIEGGHTTTVISSCN